MINPSDSLKSTLQGTSMYMDLPDGIWGLSMRGVVYNYNKQKGIERYVDFDFAGGWAQAHANNSENAMSCTGYVIMYRVCKVLWCSKLPA